MPNVPSVPSVPTVSVVIPTFNRRQRLHRVLLALADQTYCGDLEVVVVSDGSTDGTDEYLTSGGTPLAVVASAQPNQGPAVARNRGVDLATRQLVVFIDDDVVPDRGLIKAHVDNHAALGADHVVIGPMLDPPDHEMSPWVRWEQAMLAKQYAAMARGDYAPTARQFYTGNASVLRRHVVEAGGFDPSLRRAEDVELAYRLADLGLRFAFEPAAIGYHYAERTFESWWATGYAYGRNEVVMARDGGRRNVLGWVADEFHDRHALVRSLTRACVPRPRLAAAVSQVLRAVAVAGDRLHSESISRYAMSGLQNVAFY
ncbi:MAG: glycosyltransferase family 2 protein, partial [Ilumatobacteraceae bacterium]